MDFGIHGGPRINPPWTVRDDHSVMIKAWGTHKPETMFFCVLQMITKMAFIPSLSKILAESHLILYRYACATFHSITELRIWMKITSSQLLILVSYNPSWYEVSSTLSREDVIVMYIRNVWDSKTEHEGFSFRLS